MPSTDDNIRKGLRDVLESDDTEKDMSIFIVKVRVDKARARDVTLTKEMSVKDVLNAPSVHDVPQPLVDVAERRTLFAELADGQYVQCEKLDSSLLTWLRSICDESDGQKKVISLTIGCKGVVEVKPVEEKNLKKLEVIAEDSLAFSDYPPGASSVNES